MPVLGCTGQSHVAIGRSAGWIRKRETVENTIRKKLQGDFRGLEDSGRETGVHHRQQMILAWGTWLVCIRP